MSLTIFTTNVKKILAVINPTYAVAKRKPEKIRLDGTRTLTSAIYFFILQFKYIHELQIRRHHRSKGIVSILSEWC